MRVRIAGKDKSTRTIRIAHNVYNTALLSLVERGWAPYLEVGDYLEVDSWIDCGAKKGDLEVSGTNPVETLGLAIIAEEGADRGAEPFWWQREGANLYDELLERAIEASLERLSEEDPKTWAQVVRAALANERQALHESLGISKAGADKARKIINELEE